MGRIRRTPALAAELRAARAHGTSRSVFLGRSLNERTTYTYDEHGRLAEAVTTRDPEWLPDDIDEALALDDFDAENCSGCGQPKVETFDPANEWSYEGVVVACHACAAMERAKKKLDNRDGVYAFAVRKEVSRG